MTKSSTLSANANKKLKIIIDFSLKKYFIKQISIVEGKNMPPPS